MLPVDEQFVVLEINSGVHKFPRFICAWRSRYTTEMG
jgi:hypothetical protein